MAVIIHDADYYQNASEDLIDELVENELASMKFEDFNDVDENEENEIVYKSLAKSKDYDDDDDIIVAGQNSLPDPVPGMDWQKYQENVDKFFENVDNDIMESERLLNKMPNSAREIMNDIRENIVSNLNNDFENIERAFEELDNEEEAESSVEGENLNEIIDEKTDAETDALEKELKKKLKEFEEAEREKDEIRKKEEEERRKQIEMELKESELKWQQIQEKLKHEKEQIEIKKQKIEEQHNKMMINQQRCIDRNLEILKVNLDVYTNKFEVEKNNLIKYETEKKTNVSKRQVKAATLIQKHYRGYSVRKIYGNEVKVRMKDAAIKNEQQKILELDLLMRLEDEKRVKEEENKRRKIENEMRKKREQEEFERDLEVLRIKMDEEEKRRADIEKKAYLEQEENDRKALIEKQIHEEEHYIIQEPQVVECIQEENVEEFIQEPLFQEKIYEISQEPVIEKDFSTQILPMNFEILVNQAIQNEFKNPNIPLQLEALKLEEEANNVAITIVQNNEEQIPLPKLELPLIQLDLFEQWHNHNMKNSFENIKQEYETKIKLREDDKKNVQQRPRPRTSKMRQTQNIPESLLLKKSNKNSLGEINFLYFHALTSYSLNSLELCTNLTVLVLTNSQITILDGLNNCINLKYINVKSNKIEWVDLENLTQLIYLNLSNNNLSSIQNFINCNNLRYLNISHNKFTRLAFLNHNFENLQFLNASKNQLINTIGLSNCVNLQFIDLSSNNLNSIEDIDSLALLLELNGSKNNLLQIPDLTNQILLINLQLNDNSITSLNEMKSYWMPLLKILEINQNCIDTVVALNGLFNIKKVFIENNNLCDLESIEDFTNFKFLSEIYLTNNPIINEDLIDIKNFSLKTEDNSVKLKVLKNETSHSEFDLKFNENIKKIVKFIEIHKNKAIAIVDKFKSLNDQLELIDLDELLAEFNILRDFIIKLRFMFEANDMNTIFNIENQLNNYIKAPSRPSSARNRVYSARLERIKGLRANPSKILNESALKSQPSFITNLKKNYSLEQLNKYASKIQAHWKGYKTRKDLDKKVANMAATIIQSRWRGYLVRKRIEEARRKFNEENLFEFEEINLDEFEFDETKFEIKIPPAPQKQFINAFLNKPPPPRPPPHSLPPVVVPKKAWKNDTSRTNSQALSIHDHQLGGNYDFPRANNSIFIPPLHTTRSLSSALNPDSEAGLMLTSKQENISNEWGFRDHRTAILMLQRADKMKYKVERKNKLKSLDPKERLKLLRKLDKYTPRVTNQNPVNIEIPIETAVTPNNRTYEWVHAQVRDIPSATLPNAPIPLFKMSDVLATKVPKLPQIQTTSQWRNGSSNSNSTTPLISNSSLNKQPLPINTSNLLPPLSTLKLNYDQSEQDQFSVQSSRSSFTNMFMKPKKIKNGDLGNKRKKKK